MMGDNVSHNIRECSDAVWSGQGIPILKIDLMLSLGDFVMSHLWRNAELNKSAHDLCAD